MYLEFGMVKRIDEIANEHLKTINQSCDFAKDLSHAIKYISLIRQQPIHGTENRRNQTSCANPAAHPMNAI